ncbi:MAG: glycosyltransferase, partial [Pleurocapsa sp.]
QEVLKRSLQYDLGLAFMPKTSNDINLQYMIGASNKAFDYLSCGLALLVSDLPDWHSAYVKPGYGLACDPDDADSIVAALLWYLEHPTQMREMGELGRQRIAQEWNYEKQFKPVIETLQASIAVQSSTQY